MRQPLAVRRTKGASRVPAGGWTDEQFRTENGRQLLIDLFNVQRFATARGVRKMAKLLNRIFKRQFDLLIDRVLERQAMKAPILINPAGDEALWVSALNQVFGEFGLGGQITAELVEGTAQAATGVIDDVMRGVSVNLGGGSFTREQAVRNLDKGYRIGQNITRINETTRDRIRRTIERAIWEQDLTVAETAKVLRERFPQICRNRISTIARTEMGRAADWANIKSIQESQVVTHVSVFGCEAIEPNIPTYGGVPTCNIQNVPVADAGMLDFHINHTGVIVPSKFIDPVLPPDPEPSEGLPTTTQLPTRPPRATTPVRPQPTKVDTPAPPIEPDLPPPVEVDKFNPEIPKFKNTNEARQWTVDNLIEKDFNRQQLVVGDRDELVGWANYGKEEWRIVSERILEFTERFEGVRLPDYIGTKRKNPVFRYKERRNEAAAYDMKNHSLLIPSDFTKRSQLDKTFNGYKLGRLNRTVDAGYVREAQVLDEFADLVQKENYVYKKELRKAVDKFKETGDTYTAEFFEVFGTDVSQKVRDMLQIQATIIHEQGHALHAFHRAEVDSLLASIQGQRGSLQYRTYVTWKRQVSEYGSSDPHEFFAESFVRYMMGDHDRVHPDLLKWFKGKDKRQVYGIENISPILKEQLKREEK